MAKTPSWRSGRAHPRSRGENEALAASDATDKGSSPLTRGKPTTPAANPASSAAHPRSRGENRASLPAAWGMPGSSPLTRGKQVHAVRRRLGRGFGLRVVAGLIPAHAGKTRVIGGPPRRLRAHPRSRGENRVGLRRNTCARGSSPLTRGKHDLRRHDQDQTGLIPAHAGKTSMWTGRRFTARAHPRSRGENFACGAAIAKNVGSSPLTRGKLPDRNSTVGELGLIPAHAGKTTSISSPKSSDPAHPRSRGENDSGRRHPVSVKGSSPLTRGKPFNLGATNPHRRLIPAHAGKTVRPSSVLTPDRAHPRSRGEN